MSAITLTPGAIGAVGGLERGVDDVDPEDHPGAAPVGSVVDLAGAQRSRVAVVVEAKLGAVLERVGDVALAAEPLEVLREQREEVDDQSRISTMTRFSARVAAAFITIAQGVGHPAASADHPAEVVLGDLQLEHDLAVDLLDLVDLDRIGVGDQGAGEEVEQVAQGSRPAASGRSPRFPACAAGVATVRVGRAPWVEPVAGRAPRRS